MSEAAGIKGLFLPRRLPNFIVYAAPLVLVAFLLLLLGVTYLSQQSLRKAGDQELWHELEKRATTLGYFYSERKADIKSLLKDQALSTYFSNKALGMSMQYGLRDSLLSMRQRFQEMVESKKIDDSPIYLRLMLIDEEGKQLVDVGLAKGQTEPWLIKQKADTADVQFRLLISKAHKHMIAYSPYSNKGKRQGFILAEINHQEIYRKLISQDDKERQSFILLSGDAPGILRYSHAEDTYQPIPNGEATLQPILTTDQSGAQAKLSVPGTHFLLGAVSMPHQHEYLTSRWFLGALSLLAALVFTLVMVSIRTRANNLTLQSSIIESRRHRKLLEKMVEERTNDITIAKNEAEESRQRLQLVLDTIPVRVFWKDWNSAYLGCNRLFARDAGLNEPEDLIGLTDYEMSWRDQAELYRSDDKLVMETQQARLNFEEPQTTPQGDKIWLLTSKIPLRDLNGVAIGVLGTYSDITDRKQAELQMKTAREAAEKANQAKSTFLANMSHELRTPMHAILSFSQLGMDKIDRADKVKLKKYLSNINVSGNRLLLLLNDLLDLSKLEAGRMVFEFKQQDFTPVIEATHREFQELLNNKSLQLRIQPAEVSTTASFDYQKMLQVMSNLLSNAIKFTPERSSIDIVYGEGKLPSGRRSRDTGTVPGLSITVSDEGGGIPEAELELIFDKFVQSSKTKTGAGGTGLGLAISKEIIDEHDGKIFAANNPRGGAVFTLLIPRLRVEHQG